MSSNIENEINQELEKEKFINFYKRNKFKILFFILFLIFLIFGYQIKTIYINKKNSENIEQILLSKIYLDDQNKEGLNILNKVKKTNHDTISILSSYQLIDFYLKKKDEKAALEQLELLRQRLKNNDNALELLDLKEVIIRFDSIEEKEILNLLKSSKKQNFSITKNKLLHDFYIKNNQPKKAEQFLIR